MECITEDKELINRLAGIKKGKPWGDNPSSVFDSNKVFEIWHTEKACRLNIALNWRCQVPCSKNPLGGGDV